MSFTIATALTRIANLPQPLWESSITSGQQLQVINQALDKIWTYGEWAGLLQNTGPLTTTGGILTLPSQFRLLTGLQVPCAQNQTPPNAAGPWPVSIKSQQWQFSPAANGINFQVWCGPPWYALDQGDNGTNRLYQLSGVPSFIDSLTFTGIAKLRYVYATATTPVVIPDSFEGLLMAVRSLHSYDSGDTDRATREFNTALEIIERDLGQLIQNEDMGRITVDWEYSGGSIANVF